VCVGDAIIVVGQARHNGAFFDHAALTSRNHAFEFTFKRFELRNAAANVRKVTAGDRINGGAIIAGFGLKFDQLADRVHRKPEFPPMTDEFEALIGVGFVDPLTAGRSVRLPHQSDRFVIPDGGDFDAGLFGQGADGVWFLCHLNFPLASTETIGVRVPSTQQNPVIGPMSGCCENKNFDGTSPAFKRALVAVIAINATMFFVELSAGFAAQSQALKADALDFGADAATYAISLMVIGASLRARATAALFKGASLGVLALFILGMTALRVLGGEPPVAQTMGIIGVLALAANVASVLILLRWRDGDSNVRSVWLCSRNDAIGNVGVIIAAYGVALTGSAWPDLVVAGLLASLFLKSSVSIIGQATQELREHKAIAHAQGDVL